MKGLTKDEVLKQRKKYGTNSISKVTKNGFFKLFLEFYGAAST